MNTQVYLKEVVTERSAEMLRIIVLGTYLLVFTNRSISLVDLKET